MTMSSDTIVVTSVSCSLQDNNTMLQELESAVVGTEVDSVSAFEVELYYPSGTDTSTTIVLADAGDGQEEIDDTETGTESLDEEDNSDADNPSESTDDEGSESVSDESLYKSYRKLVIGLLFLSIVLFVVIDSVFGKEYVRQVITIFLEWIRENPGMGVVAFVLVYFAATLICVPGALLTLGAGFVFSASFDGSLATGVILGTVAVFLGSFASAIVAFFLARYLLFDRVRKLSERYSIFEALDIALSQKGFRIMCLLRLSPITPFVLLNYIAGVTTVKFSSYALSTFCILPGAILYVFLGATAGSLTDKSENSTDRKSVV